MALHGDLLAVLYQFCLKFDQFHTLADCQKLGIYTKIHHGLSVSITCDLWGIFEVESGEIYGTLYTRTQVRAHANCSNFELLGR